MSTWASRLQLVRPLLARMTADEVLRRLPYAVEAAGASALARYRARRIVEVLKPELVALFSSPEDELDLIYAALRELPDDSDEAPELLARADELEQAEAARMDAYFVAHRPLDPSRARAALARADELLAKHEGSSADDAAR